MNKNDFKQLITKQDVISLLNSMKNRINEDSINQYINKILTLDDEGFKQELDSNNISTIEDVEALFKDRFSKAKCKLSDLDFENSYFHFTDEANLKSIKENGLISAIGKHSEGIDKRASIFFTSGMIPTLQGADTWIKFIMHRMYGEKNQFGIYNGLDENEIKSKQHEWGEKFLNREYLQDNYRKEKAFELLYSALKEKIFLTLDLRPEIDFSFDDVDYNKKEALDKKENGDNIPYLYMKEMYGEYSDADTTVMDKWNMHTYFGTEIEPERIMQVTDSHGRTDMLHILIEMYDKCKSYVDFQVDILEDFISYARQKEISAEKVSTQRLGQEALEEINDTVFLDEIESVQAKQQRDITKQPDTQENGQNR